MEITDNDKARLIRKVGHKRIYAPYMTVYLVISLPKIPYIHRIYMVLTNPTYTLKLIQLIVLSPLLTLNLASSTNLQGWPQPYIYRYTRCTHGIFSREITIHTVMYGADIRFWPTLQICSSCSDCSKSQLLLSLLLTWPLPSIMQTTELARWALIHITSTKPPWCAHNTHPQLLLSLLPLWRKAHDRTSALGTHSHHQHQASLLSLQLLTTRTHSCCCHCFHSGVKQKANDRTSALGTHSHHQHQASMVCAQLLTTRTCSCCCHCFHCGCHLA